MAIDPWTIQALRVRKAINMTLRYTHRAAGSLYDVCFPRTSQNAPKEDVHWLKYALAR